MTLADLLHELSNNILRDQSGIVAGPSDRLWDDRTLLRYINEAYQLFCRKTLILVDKSTPSICRINLQTGVAEYPLDSRILSVISARLDGSEQDLVLSGHGLLNTKVTVTDDYFWRPSLPTQTQPDRPAAYATDEDTKVIRLFPAPSATFNDTALFMRVSRLPLKMFSLDDMTMEPEFPEVYHLSMLDWAAYRALSNHDSDAEATNRAEMRKAQFEETVKLVLKDIRRRHFATAAFRFGAWWDRM